VRGIDPKKLSMQTLSTIDSGERFDLDSAAIDAITASPKLFIKRISDVSSTRFWYEIQIKNVFFWLIRLWLVLFRNKKTEKTIIKKKEKG
jgi:hypothetical protein